MDTICDSVIPRLCDGDDLATVGYGSSRAWERGDEGVLDHMRVALDEELMVMEECDGPGDGDASWDRRRMSNLGCGAEHG